MQIHQHYNQQRREAEDMKKEKSIFLTNEGREALERESIRRGNEGMRRTSDKLYDLLKTKYRELNQAGAAGATEVIYCPERKTGKTSAIIRLAEELGVAIVTDGYFFKMYDREARDREVKITIVTTQELRTKMDGRRFNFHTVLVDETTDVQDVREAMDKIAGFGTPVNIIAIQ